MFIYIYIYITIYIYIDIHDSFTKSQLDSVTVYSCAARCAKRTREMGGRIGS